MSMTSATAPSLDRQFDELERDLGLTDDELATTLGVGPELLAQWRSGEAAPRGKALRRLKQLQAFHHHLSDTFTTREVIPAYLRTPLIVFGGKTPHELLLAGRFDQVEGELVALDFGIFS
jgi:hypothetical protein